MRHKGEKENLLPIKCQEIVNHKFVKSKVTSLNQSITTSYIAKYLLY